MDQQKAISPDDVSLLVNRLLDSKDPATVGLRKILKNKRDAQNDYPLKKAAFEEFHVEGRGKQVFSEEERRIIELEKKVIALQKENETIRRQAEQGTKAAREQGRQQGLQEGENRGSERARSDYDGRINELQQTMQSTFDSLNGWKKSIAANSEHLVVSLACELAKKIIQAELRENPEIILSVVKKAVAYIGDRERLVVRVSPLDIDTVQGKKSFWLPAGEQFSDMQIIPDAHIEKGGCIVESNSGAADARLGIQINELAELMEKTWQAVEAKK
jgi:flagellar assembly protein FliH